MHDEHATDVGTASQAAILSGRALLRCFAMGATVAVVVATLFLLLNFAMTFVPKSTFQTAAREAVAGGVLPAKFPVMTTRTFAQPRYNPNDCLIVSMLTTEIAETRLQKAVSPSYPRDVGYDFCEGMVRSIDGTTEKTNHYHRYMHGYWTVSAILLAFLSFHQATALLYAACMLLGVALIAVTARDLPSRAPRTIGYFTLAVSLLLFTGLHSFGWSLSYSLADITIIGFIIYAFSYFQRISERGLMRAASMFGAFTAAFEFLIGSTLVAVSLIVILGVFDTKHGMRETLRRIFLLLCCFCFAFIMIFAVKAAAVALMFDPGEVAAAGTRLTEWTAKDFWEIDPKNAQSLSELGVTVAQIKDSRILAFLYVILKFVYHGPYIILGSTILSVAVLLAVPFVFVTFCAYRFVTRSKREKYLYVLLIVPAVFFSAWHFTFISHSVVHSAFMNRTLAWVAVLSLASAAWILAGGPKAWLGRQPAQRALQAS